MTKEEYQSKLQEMVKNPDNAASIAADLIDAIGTDKAAEEQAAQYKAEQEKRIENLKQQNMQLFLTKIGNTSTNDTQAEEQEVTPETVARHFLDAYKEMKGAK